MLFYFFNLPLTLIACLDRGLSPAACLIGGVPKYASVSGNMRDTLATLHWLFIQQRICYRVVALVWHCLLSIAPFYLQDLYRPASTLLDGRGLRSTSVDVALVLHLNTSTMQRRAFAVAVPSIGNSPPTLGILFRPKSNTPSFYRLLKTDLYHLSWTRSAYEKVYWRSLYKLANDISVCRSFLLNLIYHVHTYMYTYTYTLKHWGGITGARQHQRAVSLIMFPICP